MFHSLPNVIETTKLKIKSPNAGHIWGGGQDGKWSHFPPVFLKTIPNTLDIIKD